MESNSPSTRDMVVTSFGIPILTAVIALISFYAGHYVTLRSSVPTNVIVNPSTAAVDVKVPASTIDVHVPAPNVSVNVPEAKTPIINVTTPPAVVRLMGPPPLVEERKAEAPVPVSVPKDEKPVTSEKPQGSLTLPKSAATLNDLYTAADSFITMYCTQRGLDPASESARWTKSWLEKVEQASRDNASENEQSYINRFVLNHSSSFDLTRHQPVETVLEACHVLLRYRDGNLDMMQKLRDALDNPSNVEKAVTLLAATTK